MTMAFWVSTIAVVLVPPNLTACWFCADHLRQAKEAHKRDDERLCQYHARLCLGWERIRAKILVAQLVSIGTATLFHFIGL